MYGKSEPKFNELQHSVSDDMDVMKSLRKKLVTFAVLGFIVFTGYNAYNAYNIKSDNELMREEISKANSTFENIKILNARIQNLESKHEMLSNCVDYLELQFIKSNKDDEDYEKSVSRSFASFRDRCQKSVELSYNYRQEK